jgi:hypothetical protein
MERRVILWERKKQVSKSKLNSAKAGHQLQQYGQEE